MGHYKSMSIYVIIGHRGTGKTSWIQEVENYFNKNNKKISIIDIDQKIEEHTQQKIKDLFQKGESFFREIEQKVFTQCLKSVSSKKEDVFISLGAGYSGSIPSSCTVIHLKRLSDSLGRVFFDRPRLSPNKSSLDEYKELYKKRESIYQNLRDLTWTRLDGFQSFGIEDEVFLGEKKLPIKNGVFTLSRKNFDTHSKEFLNHKIKMGFYFIELKNDEVSVSIMKKVVKTIPIQKILFSFRKKDDVEFESYLKEIMNSYSLNIDWPFEWGSHPSFLNKNSSIIYSLHKREENESMDDLLNRFSAPKGIHLKLAPEIFSFQELFKGHIWQGQDSKNRSFHPRSPNGRWKWYRILFSPHQKFYFLKEDFYQGVLDQPVIAEACRFKGSEGFGCVLGDPIEHSLTPFEQSDFFKKYNMSVLKILMTEKEVTSENLEILKKLGMRFAAITSPLKKHFYQLLKGLNSYSFKDSSLKLSQSDQTALNTIIFSDQWRGFNTDVYGALSLKDWIDNTEKHRQKKLSIAVWGGGGVLNTLEQAFLNQNYDISFYSARTGQIKKGSDKNPDVIIWAAGRNKDFLPHQWKPSYILDLNYTEDSPAREYSIQTQAEYISGLMWFKVQAQWQRKIFQYFNCP